MAQVVRLSGKRFFARRPDGEGGWIKGVKGVRVPLYRLPDVLAQADEPVIIVEGEKDADRLFEEGLVATTSPFGAGKWRQHHAEQLRGRTVVIVPDNDDAGRKHAAIARACLLGVAKKVCIVSLPDLDEKGDDVSDWLDAGHTADDLRTLVHTALTEPECSNYASEGRSIWEIRWANGQLLEHGSDVEIASECADWLVDPETPTVYCDGDFWTWNGRCFERLHVQRLRRKMHDFDGALFPTTSGLGVVKLNKSRLDSIRVELETILSSQNFFQDSPRGFACESGFVSFDDRGEPRLLPHSPTQRARYIVPGHWHPERRPLSTRLLRRLIGGSFRNDPDRREKVLLLAELMAIVALGLGTRLRHPKGVVFYGPTAENGKSVMLSLLKGTIPKDAVSAMPITAFGSRRMIVHLAGKHLNCSDELPSTHTVASDNFKAIITGEELVGRDVYRPMLQFRPVAQHVFACNTLPSFRGGMDRGVLRRLLVIPFEHTVPRDEQIPHLAERILEEERDALLAFTVMGARRILRSMRLTEPPSSTTVLADWAIQDDPIRTFVDEVVDVVLGTSAPWTATDEVYRAFRKYAEDAGYERRELPKKPAFTRKLLQHVPGASAVKRRGQRGILGISLNRPGSGIHAAAQVPISVHKPRTANGRRVDGI